MAGQKKTARDEALKILCRVDGGAYADIMLAEGLTGLSVVDRALATELVMGVLRRLYTLDWVISAASDVKLKRLERAVLNALRLGAYQLFFLSKVPPSAAVDETVKAVKRLGPGRASFVNAVLRRLAGMKGVLPRPDGSMETAARMSIVYSHPEWLVRRWIARYGEEKAATLMERDLTPPPRTIRVNALAGPVERTVEALSKEGLSLSACRFSPGAFKVSGGEPGPRDGRYYIQDEASQLVARLVAPRAGERILDACAAPGGKSTHMAELLLSASDGASALPVMRTSGTRSPGAIFAIDRSYSRLLVLKSAAGRLKASIIRAVAADSAAPLPFKDGVLFDAVLADAPCSGLGVLRRAPDIMLRRAPEDIGRLAAGQLGLLDNLKGRVRPGGRLVYSVCTLEPEETTGVVRAFLADNPGFRVEDASAVLPGTCGPLVDGNGFLSTDREPGAGLDGFFAARLLRLKD